MYKFLIMLISFFSLFLTATAYISVGPLRLEYGSGQYSPKNVIVKNTGKSVAFVKVDIKEVIGINTAQRREILLSNPRKKGILALPTKLIIKPGEQKNVRIMAVGKRPKEDKIFMIEVYEVESKKASDKDKSKFSIRYGTVVLIHAQGGKPHIIATRKGKSLTLENKGSTSAKVSAIVQCVNDKKETCKDPAIAIQLMPNSRKDYTLPFAQPIEFVVSYLGNVAKQTSN